MMAGDPVWLGVLAAALVDLHAASSQAGASQAGASQAGASQTGAPQAVAPLSIALEEPAPDAGGRAGIGSGIVVRAFWPGLEPTAVSPLPLALIDAVLALHGGRIRSLSADGLRLDLPGASVVHRSMSGQGRR
jgi:hypothetical protein